MSVNKYILLLITAFSLPGLKVNAQPITNANRISVTNPPSFTVASRQELIPGLPPATRIFITNGTETCALLTPDGYRIDSSVQDYIQLVNRTYDCFMAFRIVEKKPVDKSQSNSTYYRTLLSNRYPNVIFLEEFSQEAGGLSGLAFDFQWQDRGKSVQASRVVFVSSPAGILEFSLTCNPDKFRQARYDFNCLLLTFRISKAGKLEIVPRTNLI